MNLEPKIRQLARSAYYQRLYCAAKNLSGTVNFFENTTNFTGIQVMFLFWLEVYHLLYKELTQEDWENLDEAVIHNDTRTDAFLYWRTKQIQFQSSQYKQDMKKSNKKGGKGRGETLPIWSGKK